MREVEIVSLRKEREKHFLQENGEMIAKVYNTPIHFKKGNKYEEIDNTLIKEYNYYKNKNNDYVAQFMQTTNEYIMKMNKDDYFLEIKLNNQNNIYGKFLDNKVIYNEILPNIDLEYLVLPTKVKENIILKNNNFNKISFLIKTNLKLLVNDNKVDAKVDDKIIFTFEPLFMIDNSKNFNHNVHYSLTQNELGYQLDLILDEEWLNRALYPVIIDPIITNTTQEGNVYDTYISNNTDSSKNQYEYIKAGVQKYNGEYITHRSLIKFDLPTIGTGSQVIKAYLNLVSYPVAPAGVVWTIVDVHRVTKDWSEDNAKWSVMHDQYDNKIETYINSRRSMEEETEIDGEAQTLIHFITSTADITNLVKKWYADTPNYGIMLKSHEEVYVNNQYPIFYSNVQPSLAPSLIIHYRNQNGLESYMNYIAQGYTNINTYNGNLVGQFLVGKTIGEKDSISLGLIYNTNDVILKNGYKLGEGFKFNYHQTIKKVSASEAVEDINYLKYVDADGTIHYFYEEIDENGESIDIFTDEDGMGFTIKIEENSYIMSDKYGNQMLFNIVNEIGYLSTITNIEGKVVQVMYDNDSRIVKVMDSKNEEINITYNGDNIVINSNDETVTLVYQDNKLISIINLLGSVQLVYNDKALIEYITDINGLKIKYEYYEQIPHRVKKVSEYSVNNTLGNYFEMKYSYNSTTIKDNKGRIQTLTFNNSGNLVSTNTLVNNTNLKEGYSNIYGYDELELSLNGNKNKLQYRGLPIKYVNNLLNNTSFEDGTINFITEGNELVLSTEYFKTGLRSLKATSSFYQEVSVEKGKYYTFSSYIKNDNDIILSLFYDNQMVEEVIKLTNEFKRSDITIFYPNEAKSNLKIRFVLPSNTTAYIDDVQLEEGNVVNSYNMISNSDFSLGLDDWKISTIEKGEVINNNCFEVVSLDTNNKALKISMDPNRVTTLSKTFPIKGKAGDYYEVSFWYKYEGINGEEFIESYMENSVNIDFNYTEEVEIGAVSPSIFNPNHEAWQYYRYNFFSIKDYECLTLIFKQKTNINNFYITNISLIKDPRQTNYGYDENGNTDYVINNSNYLTDFNYDNNNQLVKMTDPYGKSFKYEYDNKNSSRIINGISESGINNIMMYDNFGNQIKSRISHKISSEEINGVYRIRGKGTYEYIRNINKALVFDSEECEHDLWNIIPAENEYYTISHTVINDNYFTATSNQIILTPKEQKKSLFKLIKQDNGSYHFQLYNESEGSTTYKYIKRKDNILVASELLDGDSSFEFYIETEENEFIEICTEYTDNGRFVKNVSDSNSHKIMYDINRVNGLLISLTSPKDITTDYTYDDKKRLIKIKQKNKEINYTYNSNNMLSKIKDDGKEYNLFYDEFLNIREIKLGDDITLASYIYEENNGNLMSSMYGNNYVINYVYDDLDRIKTIDTMNETYNYYYNNNGNISKIEANNDIYKYYYDSSSLKLSEYRFNDFNIQYNYDACNNTVSKKYILSNYINSINNLFNLEDAIARTKFDNNSINYDYDELGRLKYRNINYQYNTSYTYVTNGKKTTLLVESINNNDDTYKYKYDELNNITHIYHNNILENEYEYDKYNQLIEERNYLDNEIVRYIYDNYGNVLNIKILDINNYGILSEDKYEYNNSKWKDQLTKFNDKNITYDNIGNPLTIGDDTLTWINGRQLNSYNDITYKYNINGIRTSKIVNNVKIKYYSEGIKLIVEKRDNNVIYYIRNEVDDLIGIKYNNNIFYYVKNLQNDIIGILDSTYNLIVNYKYDSWGNILSITDSYGNDIIDSNHIGIINPFRYRSYYYDAETNLYYLNSRYYSPVLKRFLNTDRLLGANRDMMSYNLYAYCSNNPIINIDIIGSLSLNIASGMMKFALSVIKAKENFEKKSCVYNPDQNLTKNYCDSSTPQEKKVKVKPVLESGFGTGGISLATEIFGLDLGIKNSQFLINALEDGKEVCYISQTKGLGIFIFGYERETRIYLDCNTKETLYKESFDTYSILNVECSNGNCSAFFGVELEAQLDVGLTAKGGVDVEF